MQSAGLQKLSTFCVLGGTRKKEGKGKVPHREVETDRQTEGERERGRGRGVEKNRKNTVQRSLTSLGQKFSSPSLHFVLHFCVVKTFFSCFLPWFCLFVLLAVALPSLTPNAREKMHPGNTEEWYKVGCKSAPWTWCRCSGLWLLLLSTTQTRLICFPWVKAKTRPRIASHGLIALQVCHTCWVGCVCAATSVDFSSFDMFCSSPRPLHNQDWRWQLSSDLIATSQSQSANHAKMFCFSEFCAKYWIGNKSFVSTIVLIWRTFKLGREVRLRKVRHYPITNGCVFFKMTMPTPTTFTVHTYFSTKLNFSSNPVV